MLGRTESYDLSLQMLLKMMEYLISAAENTSLLLQSGVCDLLSPLADKLIVGSEQEKVLTEVIWRLRKFESGCHFVAITATVHGIELNEESSGTLMDNYSICTMCPKG